ncbi:MAG: 30S ribosomal protein S6 [bacterium]
MSKSKSSTLPHYELLYVISNKFSENEVPSIKETVEKLITDNQGAITLRQDWGKKKLAYPIKHFRHGYYQLLEFDMPSASVKIVANNLRLSDQIIRHQIVVKDPNAVPAKPAGEARPLVSNKPEAKSIAPEPELISKKAKTTADDDKVDLQDLDDKLDKILDSESFF